MTKTSSTVDKQIIVSLPSFPKPVANAGNHTRPTSSLHQPIRNLKYFNRIIILRNFSVFQPDHAILYYKPVLNSIFKVVLNLSPKHFFFTFKEVFKNSIQIQCISSALALTTPQFCITHNDSPLLHLDVSMCF